jgi:hypothetical protein
MTFFDRENLLMIFWVVTPYILVGGYRLFSLGGILLHLHCRSIFSLWPLQLSCCLLYVLAVLEIVGSSKYSALLTLY